MLSVTMALNSDDAQSLVDVPAAGGWPRRAPRVVEPCVVTGLHWRDRARMNHTFRLSVGH